MAHPGKFKVVLAADGLRCPVCWMAFRLCPDQKTITHGSGSCKHAGRRFLYPTVELEEVKDAVDTPGR